ncbi:MAG: YggS family pyridoxal phosphate-dependent enzyme [Candidatus Zixiibacteriota bacterium]
MNRTLEHNLAVLKSEIAAAALDAGRSADEITILAVTKTFPAQLIRDSVELGLTQIGESRVQEAEAKFEELGHIARYHLIGHLQSNKVKKAVQLFDIIQSVDSIELAKEISRRAGEFNRTIECLIEINSSGEEQKYGVRPDQALALITEMHTLPNIVTGGIMTVGPLTDDPSQIGDSFELCHDLFKQGKAVVGDQFATLSMGMSSDFTLAIMHGSTMIRLGTALFGSRR